MIEAIIPDMRPILSLKASSRLDHALIAEYGLDESTLIDNAAKKAFELTREYVSGRVLVMVGPGNNGSDGLALSLLLLEAGVKPDIFILSEKGNSENIRRRTLLPSSLDIVESTYGYDTVYDALFGFGFHGEADERTKAAIEGANTGKIVISLDVPSASLVNADVTVAFMALKDVFFEPSLRKNAGKILLANPGFPDKETENAETNMFLLSDTDSSMPVFSISDYKNSRGHIAIVGGSDKYTGAPRLSARAAFFSGAGLVTIITDSERIRDENPAVIISSPENEDLSHFDALAVGPGWGDGNRELFRRVVESGKNFVIDADALRFVSGHVFSYRAVLTPHIGEYRRLMASLSIPDGLGDPETLSSSLRSLSQKTESVVVLKSSVLWITDGERIFVYDGSNPSIGVAGSGDVLSGIITALMGEGESPLRAAIDGVILHQRAGKKAHEEYGYYSAEELILMTGRCR